MYVAELDRPWLGTPFLFQGFLIEDELVIKELQHYCKTVYVNADRFDDTIISAATPSTYPSVNGSASNNARKPPATAAKPAAARENDAQESTARLAEELLEARAAHATAEQAINDAFVGLRKGQTINVAEIKQAVTPMIDSICRNDDALSWLARMKKKNDYVYDHSIASSVWAMIFAKHLNLERSDIEIIGLGAMFMDVGKTRIPDELLEKESSLTPAEANTMRRHVKYGVEICRKAGNLDPRVIEIVECHHERYNGTGYPAGLKGNDIPIFARIGGIVDAFDAMTTPRPYAKPVSTADAMRHLNDLAGVEFQAEMVEQFIQAVGVFPVGTLVELSSGEVAVIIAQNRVRRLRPQVMVLMDSDKTLLKRFRQLDLRNQLVDANGESLWIKQGLPSGAYGIDASEFFL